MLRDLRGCGLRSSDPSLGRAHPFLLPAPSRPICAPGLARARFSVFSYEPCHGRGHESLPGTSRSQLSCRTGLSLWREHSREQGPGSPLQSGDQEGLVPPALP